MLFRTRRLYEHVDRYANFAYSIDSFLENCLCQQNRMTQQSATPESRSDLEWISQLACALSDGWRSEALMDLAVLLIVSRLPDCDPDWRHKQQNEIVNEKIEERLLLCRSNAFAHEMISMAKQNDLDLDSFLFPDGRAEHVFIADSEIRRHAEAVLNGYIYFIHSHSEHGLPHPRDFSGPKEADDDDEWARHVDDFAWMLRQWRDDFMRQLLDDCSQATLWE